jgi:uncharacterized protein with HEPN domain
MNLDDRVRLHHVVDALNSAIRFARGRERKDLDSDEMPPFDRLVHAYFDINHDILWTTVTEAAPPLAEPSTNNWGSSRN